MSAGGVLFAMAGLQAVSQIAAGRSQASENDYNASLLDQKASLFNIKRDISDAQYTRAKGQAMSTSVANVAGQGLALHGSPLAVMVDTQTQMSIDQAIEHFNIQSEKNLTQASANSERVKGKYAVASGYSQAFSTILQGASNFAMYSRTSAGTVKDSTFDTKKITPSKGVNGITWNNI